MVAPADPESLVIHRRYSACPDIVFQFWLRPEFLAKWFRPSPEYTHNSIEVDGRVGGRYRVAFKSSTGQVDVVGGEYLEITEFRRLRFTWMWEQPNEHAGIQSTVIVDFTEVDGDTDLVVTHDLSDPIMREEHNLGWSGALDQIPALIEQQKQ